MKWRGSGSPWARRSALGAALTLLAAANAAAQPAPHGPQFQVNTYGTGSQYLPSVASSPSGSFVVAWQSASDEQDDSSCIQARRYDAQGQPAGPAFLVNSATTDHQMGPGVAMAADGRFVVAFESYSGTDTDTDGTAVRARRFGPTGVPEGDEFQVNTGTTSYQRHPAVAFEAATGGFAVVWYDEFDQSILARTYAASGAPDGLPVRVSEDESSSSKGRPTVASVGDGEFVVAWEEFGPGDETDWGVRAARFDSSGSVLVPPFSVNDYGTGNQEEPSISSDGAGRFVIAWWSMASPGSDTDLSSVQARLFDAAGPTIGTFQVNTYTTGYQVLPSVAMDARGHFVVAWESTGSPESDSSLRSIHARPYDETGAPSSDEFQVNSYTTNSQSYAAVAVDGGGNFVVAWNSQGSPGDDQDYDSVQARRFDDVFRDDFEAGDWARWSSALP